MKAGAEGNVFQALINKQNRIQAEIFKIGSLSGF